MYFDQLISDIGKSGAWKPGYHALATLVPLASEEWPPAAKRRDNESWSKFKVNIVGTKDQAGG